MSANQYPPAGSPFQPSQVAAVCLLLWTSAVPAATYTWTSSTDGDWNTVSNWSPGAPVNSNSNDANFNTLDLNSSITVHLNVAATQNKLTFGDPVPSGHSWTLDNNGNAANTLTFGGTTPTITVNNLGSGTATVSAQLLGTGGIRKNGAGTLIVTGNNSSLSGSSSVLTGAFGIGHDNAFGTGTVTFAGSSGPTQIFAVNGARTLSNPITLPTNGGWITIGGRENLTFAGQVTQNVGGGDVDILQMRNSGLTTLAGGWALSSRTHICGPGDLVANSDITVGGSSGVYMYGTGTLNLEGTYNATSVLKADSGTLRINNVAANPVNVNMAGGKLLFDLEGHSAGVWNSSSALTNAYGGTLEIRGASSGSSNQTLASLKIDLGHTNFVIDPSTGSGTTFTVTTAGWARVSGATALIDLSRPGATMTSSPGLTNGILGYALVKDSSGIGFATRTGGGTGTDIIRYTSATPLASNSNSATANFVIQPSSSTPFNWNGVGNRSVNSLAIDTSLSAGVLDLGSTANTLTITSRGILMTGANDYVIQNGKVGSSTAELILHQYGTGLLNISASVNTGTGPVVKAGPGTVELSATNSYTGSTTVTGGALRAVDGVGLPTASILQLRGGVLESNGTFTRALGTSTGQVNWGAAHLNSGGGFAAYGGVLAIQLNGGTGQVSWSDSDVAPIGFLNNAQKLIFGSITANDMVDFQNSILINASATASHTRNIQVIDNPSVTTDFARISGVLSSSGAIDGIMKTGDGVLELTGSNLYLGPTYITEGTLKVSDLANGGVASNIGQSTNVASNLVLNGGTLQYSGAGATVDRGFSVGTAGGTIDASGAGALVLSNPDAVGLDAINTAGSYGARTLTLKGSSTGNNTLGGSVGDQGGATSLVKSGGGRWILTGVNSYTGSTTVSGGTLVISGSASINSSSGIAIAAGTFDYQGSTGLNRNVAVNGGTFKYNSSALYTGNLTLTSGTIGGNGNLSNTSLNIATGIRLSPGNSPGTANTGAQTWANGGSYLWEINALATSDTPGSEGNDPGWDFANISGGLTITAGSGQFDLLVDSLLALDNWDNTQNYQWRIASASGGVSGFDADAFNIVTGAFSDENSTAGTFSVSNAGNNVYLNYTSTIPEPGTALLLGLGSAWMAGRRVRRRPVPEPEERR